MNIILWAGIGIGILIIIFLIFSLIYSHRKRNNLHDYMVYLLLEDKIREDHKIKFVSWIKELSELETRNIRFLASQTLEQMSDSLAQPPDGRTSSSIGATFMLLNVWKENQQNRS